MSLITLPSVLPPEEIGAVVDALGGAARGVLAEGPARHLAGRLMAHRSLVDLVLPVRLGGFAWERLAAGDPVGERVVPALSAGLDGAPVRADVLVTLFLDDPATYDGGELVATAGGTQQGVKPPAGTAVLCPASATVGAAPVTRAVRRTLTCSIQSHVREAAARDILSEVTAVLGHLERLEHPDRAGRDRARQALHRARHNLIRQWAET